MHQYTGRLKKKKLRMSSPLSCARPVASANCNQEKMRSIFSCCNVRFKRPRPVTVPVIIVYVPASATQLRKEPFPRFFLNQRIRTGL